MMTTPSPLIPRPNDRLMCLKVGIIKRENFYEMTRKYWYAKLERASKATHVLAVVEGIVKAVYIPERWFRTDNADYPNRIEFVGKDVADSDYLGKSVKHLHIKGNSNPVLYINM